MKDLFLHFFGHALMVEPTAPLTQSKFIAIPSEHPHAVFRADASESMGAGHISRCVTLATSLKRRGCRVTFICAKGSTTYAPQVHAIADAVIELPHEPGDASTWLTVAPSVDAAATVAAIAAAGADWLVVDHYGIGREWEQQVRPHVGRLMVIDDLANRPHDCDVLLDQNLRPDGAEAYRDLVPNGAMVLQGPRYALLRDEFTQRRPHHVRTNVNRVLVSFGGVDGANGTSTALDALGDLATSIAVDVVIGAQHPAYEHITEVCKQAGYSCHVQTTAIADLMDTADLAIGAGGASSWERCIVGLPSVVLVMADNQRMIAGELAACGAAANLGDHYTVRSGDIAAGVERLCASETELMAMSTAAYAVMADHIDVAEVLLDHA
jgi:UDP-2,4-diacetamido-2,4,6-trideoxy-beta-L-altropyranose hydrolase